MCRLLLRLLLGHRTIDSLTPALLGQAIRLIELPPHEDAPLTNYISLQISADHATLQISADHELLHENDETKLDKKTLK